jgi:thioredoxin 1
MQNMNNLKEEAVKRSAGLVTLVGTMVLIAVLSLAGLSYAAGESPVPAQVPVKDKVTMVDIGAKKCIPCKMMAPIMEELEKEYGETGKAAIIFIDVWENQDQGKRFGIRSIPTQIFYDKSGKEVYRHEGFLEKKAIVERLESMGVK